MSSFSFERVAGEDALLSLLNSWSLLSESVRGTLGERYVLYCNHAQQSLIGVELAAAPFVFYYCDLMGRSMTRAIRQLLEQFLRTTIQTDISAHIKAVPSLAMTGGAACLPFSPEAAFQRIQQLKQARDFSYMRHSGLFAKDLKEPQPATMPVMKPHQL